MQTATTGPLADDGWQTVAKGRKFSHAFGFGTIDVYRIVVAAKKYQRVGKQSIIPVMYKNVGKPIPQGEDGIADTSTITSDMISASRSISIEHIQVTVHIDHQRRGDVHIQLISPGNVKSDLIVGRGYDSSREGFKNWTMTTVAHW